MQLALDQMARQGFEQIEVSEQVAGPTESDLETEEETLFFGLTPHRRLATTRPPRFLRAEAGFHVGPTRTELSY